MNEILAKSRKAGQKPVTLLGHTLDVIEAAQELFGDKTPSRLGTQWLRFFQLPEETWPIFRRHLFASCAFHDWGKANNTFQAALHRTGSQAIRHEHLSTLLIGLPSVTQPLQHAGYDVPLLLSVVLTHHLKAGSRSSDLARRLPDGAKIFRLIVNDHFQAVADVGLKVGLPQFDTSMFPETWRFGNNPNNVDDHQDNIRGALMRLQSELATDSRRSRLLVGVRASLIAADAAGSGLVRQGHRVIDWIRENVTRAVPLTKERIANDIIKPRVGELKAAGKWEDWNDFQLGCDHLPARALLLAPCGSGKTLAAWRWIAAQLVRRPARHVLFLYPTRATAREGFKDYVSWAPEADAKLMHGTSAFDLDGMFANPPEDSNDDRGNRNYEVEQRLFSLGYWPGRAFSATVDQFLAFMQYAYSPMCMLPVLADSIVVIDEVHSYDRNMFAALKGFLKNFDVPVLCMTATLPSNRRKELVDECKLSPSPDWPDDLLKIAELPRYRVTRVVNRAEATGRVWESLRQGKRVLWVVNQVRRTHEILKDFAPHFDPAADTGNQLTTSEGHALVCYHSRFRLIDRVDRHAETMNHLKKPAPGNQQAALGITTQVCEMSLDIDVDLLVTEHCPVTAFVQRMGRCNRERRARPLTESGEVLIYTPDGNSAEEANRPYSTNDLAGLNEFVQQAQGYDHLSQARVDEIMNSPSIPVPALEGDPDSQFLISGAFAVGSRGDDGEAFREGTDYNRPCVLPDDDNIGAYISGDATTRPGLIIPIPRRHARYRDKDNPLHKKLPAYLGIAEPGHYHSAIGYCDEPLNTWRQSNG